MIAAEWVKFRTVRGWVLATIIAAAAIAGFAVAGGGQGSCDVASCTQLLGPGGEAVSDSFYFVHQPLAGNASVTARVSALVSSVPVPRSPGSSQPASTSRVLVPWAKAGIILKASLRPGSAYAAIMVTGSHGVRMQDDYTGDIAGPAMTSGWLRLTRAGDMVTGWASANGARWTKVGTVTLRGFPARAQGGLFVTSPQYSQTSLGVTQVTGSPSASTATFSHAELPRAGAAGTDGTGTGTAWAGTAVGGSPGGPAAGPATGWSQAGGTGTGGTGTGGTGTGGTGTGGTGTGGIITITGSGDIAPVTNGPNGVGATITQALGGIFIALVILTVTGAMFITAEYRRGLIGVTLAACPSRGRVLAAKACVTGLTAFAAGLAGMAVAVPVGQRVLRSHGVYLPPLSTLTEIRVIVGTAAALAVCAVLALAIGTAARRGAAAVAAVLTLVVLPYVLTVPIAILPLGLADWVMRVLPAAGFAVQATEIQYPQVNEIYAPAFGYFPLSPLAGFGVLCAWAGAALAVAYVVLRRRDA
jgi:hypothetical protein